MAYFTPQSLSRTGNDKADYSDFGYEYGKQLQGEIAAEIEKHSAVYVLVRDEKIAAVAVFRRENEGRHRYYYRLASYQSTEQVEASDTSALYSKAADDFRAAMAEHKISRVEFESRNLYIKYSGNYTLCGILSGLAVGILFFILFALMADNPAAGIAVGIITGAASAVAASNIFKSRMAETVWSGKKR